MTPTGTEAWAYHIPVTNPSEPIPRKSRLMRMNQPTGTEKAEPRHQFATRADVKGVEGISKSKLILLGGGLAVAVLFFVFHGYRRQVAEEAGGSQSSRLSRPNRS